MKTKTSVSAAGPIRLSWPKTARLRTTEEFRRCYDAGYRAGDSHLLVFATTSHRSRARVGVSVSKKHGNSVQRNRKKRLLREACRLCLRRLPALDLVLMPRQTSRSTLEDYRSSLNSLAARLEKRINRTSRRDKQ